VKPQASSCRTWLRILQIHEPAPRVSPPHTSAWQPNPGHGLPRCCPGPNMLTHMASPDNVVVCEAARAVILDPDQRILLIHFVDERRGASWWATPGGGLRPGETRETAALREVAEETGHTTYRSGPVSGPARTNSSPPAGSSTRPSGSSFCRARPSTHAPTVWKRWRSRPIREYRWWSLDEIQRSTDEVAPGT
jgi:8-oxo-dGTP pyrophosphatase MutT (NUDIX family)